MRHLSVVVVTVLLSIALSGVASAQTDSRAEQEALDWQRRVIEAAIAETQAELAAVEAAPDEPDAMLIFEGPGGFGGGRWHPLTRAEIELALQFFPVYELASHSARSSFRELKPALGAIERSISDDLTLASLLEMDEAARWKHIRSENQRGSQLKAAEAASKRLKDGLSELQDLLAAVDGELDGLRPLQPALVDEPQDDTPVVDEPQEEPLDTPPGAPGFDGAWTTASGNRMELARSGSSVTGPYGRMSKAHENGDRTLGVVGDMDLKVNDERTLEGFWIKGSASSVKCKSPMKGSYYWGQQLMEFDEAFMSWTGAWTYCDGSLWRDSGGDRIQEP